MDDTTDQPLAPGAAPSAATASSWEQPARPERPGPAPGIEYAGFWIRVGAYLIDAIPLIRRSWSLVAGSTWPTISILLLVGLVFGIIGLVVSPVNIPGVMEGYLEGSQGSYVVVAVVGGAIQIALGPILPTLVTVLFFDYAADRP